jgi:hypothetical protein
LLRLALQLTYQQHDAAGTQLCLGCFRTPLTQKRMAVALNTRTCREGDTKRLKPGVAAALASSDSQLLLLPGGALL